MIYFIIWIGIGVFVLSVTRMLEVNGTINTGLGYTCNDTNFSDIKELMIYIVFLFALILLFPLIIVLDYQSFVEERAIKEKELELKLATELSTSREEIEAKIERIATRAMRINELSREIDALQITLNKLRDGE